MCCVCACVAFRSAIYHTTPCAVTPFAIECVNRVLSCIAVSCSCPHRAYIYSILFRMFMIYIPFVSGPLVVFVFSSSLFPLTHASIAMLLSSYLTSHDISISHTHTWTWQFNIDPIVWHASLYHGGPPRTICNRYATRPHLQLRRIRVT